MLAFTCKHEGGRSVKTLCKRDAKIFNREFEFVCSRMISKLCRSFVLIAYTRFSLLLPIFLNAVQDIVLFSHIEIVTLALSNNIEISFPILS